ncbi:MAG: hypothetical protein JW748_12485 [Anaerolineales bacterium]|nr:hypothetical protein [Anaerolineales bacterium]
MKPGLRSRLCAIGLFAALAASCNFPRPGATVASVTSTAPETATATMLSPGATPSRTQAGAGIRGRLANPGFENQPVKTTLFFAGQARDGSTRYDCIAGSNMGLYTAHPIDPRHLKWSEAPENRSYALGLMAAAGLNTVTMSSWGEDFLPCNDGWAPSAPMQTAPGAHDELFMAAAGANLLILPFLESHGDWTLRSEFPTDAAGRTAPGALRQILNLIDRYLKNPDHPEWAGRWAQVYDREGQPRYGLVFIHASSDRLGPADDAAFASGFDLLAGEVFRLSGVRVGFLLDPLPPASNAPGIFKPSPERTGAALAQTPSVLGLQAFIPEIWITGPAADPQRIAWKRDFSRRWSETGIPFLMDVSPGYDAHIVFPGSVYYGFTAAWRDALAEMVADFGGDGLVYNSWNGYTEGMAAVPTREYNDVFFRWLQGMAVRSGLPG